MKYKIGQLLYHAWSYTDDDGKGKCECDLWVVRTIRGGKITAIQRNEFTWVRNPDKFGGPRVWEKSIHSMWRKTWREGQPAPLLYTTKREAWKQCMELELRWPCEEDDSDEDKAVQAKVIETCKRMMARKT